MLNERLIFRIHAIKRMAQRAITVEDVRQAISAGEVIENYPDDVPYPSALMLGWSGDRPLHVVVATTTDLKIIITVYEPDLSRWEPDFKKRKL